MLELEPFLFIHLLIISLFIIQMCDLGLDAQQNRVKEYKSIWAIYILQALIHHHIFLYKIKKN